jgi:integrase
MGQAASEGPSIDKLILAYWRHAEGYYRRPDGSPTGEQEQIRLALRPLRSLYGSTLARDFSPKALKLVRQAMIGSGLCRRTINQRVGRILRAFRFGVENELVPAPVLEALKSVAGLRSGRSAARESRPVQPVPDERVEAVRPFLSRQLRAVVDLQRLTGMRSDEVLAMRTGDLDVTGPLWEYVPERHKSQHHGKVRRIFLGPRAQEILRPLLRTDPAEYLFQPREAMAERWIEQRRTRKTPLTPSQRTRTRKARPRKVPGGRYDARAYAHAVARACDRAFPHPMIAELGMRPRTSERCKAMKEWCRHHRDELKEWHRAHRWHPHQLRHNAATRFRKEFGLDVARAILGHSSPVVTEIYAEADEQKAKQVMERVG